MSINNLIIINLHTLSDSMKVFFLFLLVITQVLASETDCGGGYDGDDYWNYGEDCTRTGKYCLNNNRCVNCINNGHCRGQGSTCGATCQNNNCVGTGWQCADPTPHCIHDDLSCVECLNDDHCGDNTPFCDPGTKTCQACHIDSHCRSTDNCNARCHNFQCLNELNVTDCRGTPTPLCDTERAVCVFCLQNEQCLNPTPHCAVNGTCEACLVHDHCRSNTQCDSTCSAGECAYGTLDCSTSVQTCRLDQGVCVQQNTEIKVNPSFFHIVVAFFFIILFI